ncbi:hypothetical protein HPB47_017920 [Ixodes persulcatus]|uniref:Uncharacterized protein n=1 Tax=Ixodes persulcatus TaxID=34615 RepID=A0AC60QM25_IXOPE|nr:hypothetical protein HPB47_017920 [Ixodes persulcatus]
MGRKRKLPSDYVKEFPDFEVSTSAEATLVRKFCRVTVSVNNGKGAVRIAEHMHSQRHVQLKKPRLDTGHSSHQDSIEECITRSRSNRQEADDIPHQFCRPLCHAGVPLHQADGPLGSLFRSKCPAARTMPASYMQKLHKDLQLSSPEFKALHFKDPCHLLNNVLDDGLKTDSFVVVYDFVVHFPALLKSSRELRRKFGLVCTSMGMKIKCLSTVSPSRWFSFHKALEDILDYWRAILSFLRSDDAKGKKCEKLKALVSSPDDVHDLLIKLKFLKTNSSAVLSIIKELEAESTLVYEVYPILGVRFCALLSQ